MPDYHLSVQRNTGCIESRLLHNQAKPYGHQACHQGISLSQSRTVSRTQVGLLVVESNVRSSDNIGPGKCYKSLEFRFACIPRCSVIPGQAGIIGAFSHQWICGISKPRITRFVRVVNVVPRHSAAFQCIRTNDVTALRKLLVQRSASPYDYSENGRSLLCVSTLYRNSG